MTEQIKHTLAELDYDGRCVAPAKYVQAFLSAGRGAAGQDSAGNTHVYEMRIPDLPTDSIESLESAAQEAYGMTAAQVVDCALSYLKTRIDDAYKRVLLDYKAADKTAGIDAHFARSVDDVTAEHILAAQAAADAWRYKTPKAAKVAKPSDTVRQLITSGTLTLKAFVKASDALTKDQKASVETLDDLCAILDAL